MASEQTGPSYYDCGRLAEDLRARTGYLVKLDVTPPVPVANGPRWTSWSVCARLVDARGRTMLAGERHAQWGSGGAHKTFPGALHAAMTELWVTLDEAQRVAEGQTRF